MSRSRHYSHSPAPHNYLGMSLTNTPVLVISRPMPQQYMPAPYRTPQVRRASQRQTRTQDQRKRYGMVFTSNPLRGMLDDDDDDDESTWSMSRSRPSQRVQSRRRASVRMRNGSPAQEIVARYRASHSGDERTGASSSVSYLQIPSVDRFSAGTRSRTTSGETCVSDVSGPRLRYRDSRAHAMEHATKEAYLMAVQCESYRNIPCQRPGCRDILPTIRDLASHLTIHDLDSRDRYSSFIDMGHSIEGRYRRCFMPSPAPYARSIPSRHKLRKYLLKLACPCIPRHGDSDDDGFF